MTSLTISWVSGIRMVRVGGCIVIGSVAAVAGVGCIVVIAIVAHCTAVGNGSVCPVECIIIIVNREGGRFPVRSRCVAHGTIGRQIQGHMVWVGTRVVIGRVATCASIGCIGIVAVVAGITIGSDGYMRSCKGIYCTVIEDGRRPGRL